MDAVPFLSPKLLQKKTFSVFTFDTVKIQHLFCQHRVSLVEVRQKYYNLTIKGHQVYL